MKWGYQAYYKYPKEYQFGGKKVLNVGCDTSYYPAPNVVNLDSHEGEGINLVHDLTVLPLPFADETFDGILANHVLEHIPNWGKTFADLFRILKVGGVLEVWVPADGSSLQLGSFTHINVINRLSFHSSYFQGNVNMSGPFHVLYESKLLKWLPSAVTNWMVEHLRNMAMETRFLFTKTGR